MQKHIVILLIFFLTSQYIVYGINENKTKTVKLLNKKINNYEQKLKQERTKRSLNEGSVQYYLPDEDTFLDKVDWYENHNDESGKRLLNKETPFWATRGRRDSASEEQYADLPLTTHIYYNFLGKTKNVHKLPAYLMKQRHDEIDAPFWGNRGRRASEESNENEINLFWANRGRRQDDDPFWGTRGRRQEEAPFWGNRGRRENLYSTFKGDDIEPFWGNRGRRETQNQDLDANGKSRIRSLALLNEETEPFWGNRGRRKLDVKESIVKAISEIEKNIDRLNKDRNSKIKSLLNGPNKNPVGSIHDITKLKPNNEIRSKPFGQNTIHNDRIYAEEPHYILVERSGRSSEEDDPFFITRGKKYNCLQLDKARGRRGALEDIFKSVRNDPYYIARGKKDTTPHFENSSSLQKKMLKAKDLICATIELTKANKVKRQASDSERDRRTTLKKLALQLQMDPYFVSRGKKFDSNVDLNSVEELINQISVTCN
ncbi:uncharacterized protein LOC116774163 [Danaus plexippus]|uniref:uncharacterized protein LOC116774163 n=1 Tax=Danaus plexippus TaxID=13037 RepID=UPI002AB182FF|nr:uncharacterized protein LOC116774163 [Danaus plexippus]